jgi:hypothetical protein
MAKQVKKATKQDRVDLIPDRPEPYWSAKVEALEREAEALDVSRAATYNNPPQPTDTDMVEMGNLHPDMPTPRMSGVLTGISGHQPDPFREKVSQWLTEAHEAKIVIDSGNSISPSEVQRLMTRAIGIIETLSAK